MKKTIIRILAATLLMAFAMSLAACADSNIYDTIAEDGYTVKIRYESGGAIINGTQNVAIVEVFNDEDVVTVGGKTGIRLLAPDDSARGQDGIFKLQKVDANNNYFMAGWYLKRTPRTDEHGQPLDAYGILTSVSGREQAYVYQDKWDFENDLVDPDALENGELTLYAAWVPFFTYEFYAENGEGGFALIGTKNKIDLQIPKWNAVTERWSMYDFPSVSGKIFDAAYLDEALTQEITANIDGDGTFVDDQQGISTQTVVKIYITWAEPTA